MSLYLIFKTLLMVRVSFEYVLIKLLVINLLFHLIKVIIYLFLYSIYNIMVLIILSQSKQQEKSCYTAEFKELQK